MNLNPYQLYISSKEYELWPIKESLFNSILYGTNHSDIDNETKVFEEKMEDNLVGYLSVKIKDGRGVINFIFVDAKYRNKGIGSRLLNQGIEYLKLKNVSEITVGAKAGTYFFPGLPKNLKIENFFKNFGFEIKDNGLVDMYQDITNWAPSTEVYTNLEKIRCSIQYSNAEVAGKIIEFANENFPHWTSYYKHTLEKKKYDEVFYASIDDKVVGISKLWIGDCNWDILFENNVGGGGALGVSDKYRGKGIGLAMKSWGTEKIKEKGIKYVWIGWTYAIDFYKKLGFQVWREYYSVKLKT